MNFYFQRAKFYAHLYLFLDNLSQPFIFNSSPPSIQKQTLKPISSHHSQTFPFFPLLLLLLLKTHLFPPQSHLPIFSPFSSSSSSLLPFLFFLSFFLSLCSGLPSPPATSLLVVAPMTIDCQPATVPSPPSHHFSLSWK